MSWTEQKIQMLQEMWGNGFSASDIARRLGGLSRNAVIGKAHRLKLSGRAGSSERPAAKLGRQTSPARAQPEAGSRKMLLRSAPAALPAPSSEPRLVTLKRVSTPTPAAVPPLKTTERQCRWPFGDPRTSDFKFCGCGAVEGLPYCPDHAKIAYQNYGRSRRRDEDETLSAPQPISNPAE